MKSTFLTLLLLVSVASSANARAIYFDLGPQRFFLTGELLENPDGVQIRDANIIRRNFAEPMLDTAHIPFKIAYDGSGLHDQVLNIICSQITKNKFPTPVLNGNVAESSPGRTQYINFVFNETKNHITFVFQQSTPHHLTNLHCTH